MLEAVVNKQKEMAESFWQYLGYSEEPPGRNNNCPVTCLKTPVGTTFGILDVAMRQNVRSRGWASGLGYKEIKFDETGQMYYRLPGQKKFSPVNFIKLIGTIAKDKIDIDALLEKKPFKGTLYIENRSPVKETKNRKYLEILNTVSISEFKWQCLPFLKPDIVEGHYLFSIHRKASAMDKVFLEGVVTRISKT